mmetsp:Transcript_8062/g.17207  ORF Transcript_8062/g.17207 Transcript_8062/m.17207 type:complete len:249 (+) Transcript_8062:538-1284(+)
MPHPPTRPASTPGSRSFSGLDLYEVIRGMPEEEHGSPSGMRDPSGRLAAARSRPSTMSSLLQSRLSALGLYRSDTGSTPSCSSCCCASLRAMSRSMLCLAFSIWLLTGCEYGWNRAPSAPPRRSTPPRRSAASPSSAPLHPGRAMRCQRRSSGTGGGARLESSRRRAATASPRVTLDDAFAPGAGPSKPPEILAWNKRYDSSMGGSCDAARCTVLRQRCRSASHERSLASMISRASFSIAASSAWFRD